MRNGIGGNIDAIQMEYAKALMEYIRILLRRYVGIWMDQVEYESNMLDYVMKYIGALMEYVGLLP